MRHGQSQANADKIIADPSSPLTKQGLHEARDTAVKLKDLGITKIVTSPMLRAQQTAEVIAAELGLDIKHIQVINELTERRLGDFETKPKEHESEWYFALNDGNNIEPQDALIKRMQICLEKIKTIETKGMILAVGHAVSGYYLEQVAKGRSNFKDFDPPQQMPNADFIKVKFNARTA